MTFVACSSDHDSSSLCSSYTCICDLEGLCMRHLWRPGKIVSIDVRAVSGRNIEVLIPKRQWWFTGVALTHLALPPHEIEPF